MFIIERRYANGSSTFFGLIIRRKTAEKVRDRFRKSPGAPGAAIIIHDIIPWRRAFKRR